MYNISSQFLVVSGYAIFKHKINGSQTLFKIFYSPLNIYSRATF